MVFDVVDTSVNGMTENVSGGLMESEFGIGVIIIIKTSFRIMIIIIITTLIITLFMAISIDLSIKHYYRRFYLSL